MSDIEGDGDGCRGCLIGGVLGLAFWAFLVLVSTGVL